MPPRILLSVLLLVSVLAACEGGTDAPAAGERATDTVAAAGDTLAGGLARFRSELNAVLADIDQELAQLDAHVAALDSTRNAAPLQRLAELRHRRNALSQELSQFARSAESTSRETARRLNVQLSTLQGEITQARLEAAADREAFVRAVSAELDEVDRALAGLEARIEASGGELRADYRQQLQSLRGSRQAVAETFAELENATERQFAEGRRELARDVAELKASIRAALNHMEYAAAAERP